MTTMEYIVVNVADAGDDGPPACFVLDCSGGIFPGFARRPSNPNDPPFFLSFVLICVDLDLPSSIDRREHRVREHQKQNGDVSAFLPLPNNPAGRGHEIKGWCSVPNSLCHNFDRHAFVVTVETGPVQSGQDWQSTVRHQSVF
jgi:hypothetical protein